MRSNSSACGLPTSARHSRWPEPPLPEEQYPGRRCSRDYSCKRRMYFGCPRPGYVQNSQSRPKGTDYLYKCGKSPDTACACRERYGMRQSGLCDGFQEYDRQQPPRGLLPVMIPIRCDFDPPPGKISSSEILSGAGIGGFRAGLRTGISRMLPGQVLPNRIDHLDGYRIRYLDFTRHGCRRLAGNDRLREGLVFDLVAQ